jgi:hypothetical protein
VRGFKVFKSCGIHNPNKKKKGAFECDETAFALPQRRSRCNGVRAAATAFALPQRHTVRAFAHSYHKKTESVTLHSIVNPPTFK